MKSTGTRIWSERWCLAALEMRDLVRIGLVSVIVGLAYILFHIQGNTNDINIYGRSVIEWMLSRWRDPAAFGGLDYSHGFLIPFVSMGILWWKRQAIASAPKEVSRIGLAIVVLALMFHWMGVKSQQPRVSLFSLLMLCWSVPFYFYGWEMAKLLMFPCVYLVFCIPLNFLDSLTFPLRIFATVVSTAVLNGLGIEAERSGSAIYSTAAGRFNFDVADPCSGIRSMLAMTALTAVYAYVTQKTLLKKWILFLSSIPLAIIGNIARIVTIALVAEAFGQKLATGLYHDYSGYIFFPVAIGLMVGIGSLLNLDYKQAWKQWKQHLLSPTSSLSA